MSRSSTLFMDRCQVYDLPCWICGGRIVLWDRKYWSRDEVFSKDHYWPISLRPDLRDIVSNWRASHRLCNNRRGSRTPEQTIWVGDMYTGRWEDEDDDQYAERIKRETERRGVAWPYPMISEETG